MRVSAMARCFAALLAPVLVVGVAVPTGVAARCGAGGLTREECCCHTAKQAPLAPLAPRVERRCCCEIDAPGAPAAPVHATKAAGATFAPTLVALAVATSTLLPRADSATPHIAPPARAPSVGPPLILLTRSILI